MLHAALLGKRRGQEVTHEKSCARCPGFIDGSVGSSHGQKHGPAGQRGGGLVEGLVLPAEVCSSAQLETSTWPTQCFFLNNALS